jgi:(p)ppGpp synthase/HD superfamily hydrolase
MGDITKHELIGKIQKNNIAMSPILEKAFLQAEASHIMQKRLNGKPYLEQHIYPVVSDLIDYCNASGVICREDLIVAALLHDVLEDDKKVTKREFIRKFGLKVYLLVHPITKKFTAHQLNDIDRILMNSDYWKNITKSSIYCILIKLADKTNNLESDLEIVSDHPDKVRLDIENIEFNYLPYTEKNNKYYHDKITSIVSELKKYLNEQPT